MRCAMGIAAVLAMLLAIRVPADAAVIWTGPEVTFTKAEFADPLLPQNQDRLTDLVWITRKNTEGIFNIRQETGYAHNVSPAGTEWAYGDAANWPALTFRPWEIWVANNPPGAVGQPAVMHLIAENIYLDITFLSWTTGRDPGGGGGGFFYARSTPEPAGFAVLGLCAVVLLARIRPTRTIARKGSRDPHAR